VNDREERMQLNKPLFEAPGQRHGTAQHKPHAPKAWARRDERLPGRSMHAERKEADKKAAAAQAETLDERLARIKALASKKDLEKRAAGRKRQGLVDTARPGVWELQSWMDGGARCPDERIEWEQR
jgi:hypothetical protein